VKFLTLSSLSGIARFFLQTGHHQNAPVIPASKIAREVRAVVSLNDVELPTAFLSSIDKTSSST
jgi:hypothetical protein